MTASSVGHGLEVIIGLFARALALGGGLLLASRRAENRALTDFLPDFFSSCRESTARQRRRADGEGDPAVGRERYASR